MGTGAAFSTLSGFSIIKNPIPTDRDRVFYIAFSRSLYFDFNIHSAGKLKFHECIHRLGAVGIYINKALEGAQLELLPRLLIHMG